LQNLSLISYWLTFDILNKATVEVEKAFERGIITQIQFDDASADLQTLRLASNRLLGLIMRDAINDLLNTDIDSPASRIRTATDRLREASGRIDDFMAFLSSLGDVIRIATGIIVAVQTGGLAMLAG
jgi:hypothetical protein